MRRIVAIFWASRKRSALLWPVGYDPARSFHAGACTGFGRSPHYYSAVLPLLSAASAVCRAGAAVKTSIADEMREEPTRRVLGVETVDAGPAALVAPPVSRLAVVRTTKALNFAQTRRCNRNPRVTGE